MGGRAGGGSRGGSGRSSGGIRTSAQAAAAVSNVQKLGQKMESAKAEAMKAQMSYYFGGQTASDKAAMTKAQAKYKKANAAYEKAKSSTSKKLKAYGGDVDLPF